MAVGSFLRRNTLWWSVPAGILAAAAVAAASAGVMHRGGAKPLAGTTADALISGLHDARDTSYSGTLVAQMSLNLPVSQVPAGSQSPELLMAGSHTMRYWYGGPSRQRAALLTATSESDVFHVGTDVWQWNSQTRVATHSVLAPAAQLGIGAPISPAPLTLAALTPQQLTERTLAAVDGQTSITVQDGPVLADRPTYELLLTPSASTGTRIASVRIDVDAARKVPLGVQVFARGVSAPSIDVSFTSVTFKTPSSEYFEFSPPAGAKVQPGAQPQIAGAQHGGDLDLPDTGWTAITEYRVVKGSGAVVPRTMQTLMTGVSGDWGKGSLLDTPLLCMLVTRDGRVLAGSVDPSVLFAAAAEG